MGDAKRIEILRRFFYLIFLGETFQQNTSPVYKVEVGKEGKEMEPSLT